MARTGIYTAEQLAELAGLPLRTVRYYVQEELIDAPLGLGRGSHFDNKHLSQLKRIKLLRDAGFDLKEIRERGGNVERILGGLHVGNLQELAKFRALMGGLDLKSIRGPGRAKLLLEKLREVRRLREQREGELNPDTAVRIPMADGVELLVDPERDMPSPKDLVEIALLIRKIFGAR